VAVLKRYQGRVHIPKNINEKKMLLASSASLGALLYEVIDSKVVGLSPAGSYVCMGMMGLFYILDKKQVTAIYEPALLFYCTPGKFFILYKQHPSSFYVRRMRPDLNSKIMTI
jgi:hypothetical protein